MQAQVGLLMNAIVCTRPDSSFAVTLVGLCQIWESFIWEVVKWSSKPVLMEKFKESFRSSTQALRVAHGLMWRPLNKERGVR